MGSTISVVLLGCVDDDDIKSSVGLLATNDTHYSILVIGVGLEVPTNHLGSLLKSRVTSWVQSHENATTGFDAIELFSPYHFTTVGVPQSQMTPRHNSECLLFTNSILALSKPALQTTQQ